MEINKLILELLECNSKEVIERKLINKMNDVKHLVKDGDIDIQRRFKHYRDLYMICKKCNHLFEVKDLFKYHMSTKDIRKTLNLKYG